MQGIKYNEDIVIEKLKEKLTNENMEFISFDGEYKNTRKTKAIVKCNVCGHIDKLPVDSVLNRTFGCKKCNKRVATISENDLKEKCKLMGNEFIGFVNGEYKNGKSQLIYKCNKCGKTIIVNCRNFMKDCYRGCCAKPHHLSSEEYEEKLKVVLYENNYDLLEVKHKVPTKGFNTTSLVTYKCNKCGNVTTTTLGHIVNEGNRCPGCNGGAKISTDVIHKRINERCDELNCIFIRFLNDENKYKNNLTRVLVKCKTCNYEWETSYAHFIRDTGCPKCGGNELLTHEEAIERAFEKGKENKITVLGFVDKKYKNNKSKLKLICNKCGYEWEMKYANFMVDRGCPKCAIEYRASLRRSDTDSFIEKARKIHGYKYDYSNTNYANSKEDVCIICPIHGEFWQKPTLHLRGCGCPYCEGSNLEKMVRTFLEESGISFEQEKSFDWLKYEKPMRLDFYLPDYNIAIECQGGQHFMPVSIFEGEEGFKKTIERDKIKNKLCEKYGIKIYYYSNLGIEYPYKVYENFNEMIKDIKDHSYFKNLEKLLCESTVN